MLTFDEQLCEVSNDLMDLLAGKHGVGSEAQTELVGAALSLLGCAGFIHAIKPQPEAVRDQFDSHLKLALNACQLLFLYHCEALHPTQSTV